MMLLKSAEFHPVTSELGSNLALNNQLRKLEPRRCQLPDERLLAVSEWGHNLLNQQQGLTPSSAQASGPSATRGTLLCLADPSAPDNTHSGSSSSRPLEPRRRQYTSCAPSKTPSTPDKSRCGRCVRIRSKSAPHRSNSGHAWPIQGQTQPKSGDGCRDSADIGPNLIWPEFDRGLLGSVDFAPSLVNVWPYLTKSGQHRPEFDGFGAEFGQVRPKWA